MSSNRSKQNTNDRPDEQSKPGRFKQAAKAVGQGAVKGARAIDKVMGAAISPKKYDGR